MYNSTWAKRHFGNRLLGQKYKNTPKIIKSQIQLKRDEPATLNALKLSWKIKNEFKGFLDVTLETIGCQVTTATAM